MLTDRQKLTIQQIVNIFETGTADGDYGNVTSIAGDAGGLTYGRSQTTINSGNLYLLLKDYVELELQGPITDESDRLALFIRLNLPRFKAKDSSLAQNSQIKAALLRLGADQDMRWVQDRFFERVYLEPALKHAERLGMKLPLSYGLVYDGFIHGSFERVRKLFPEPSPSRGGDEKVWDRAYVKARRAWLLSKSYPLKDTYYRMDAYQKIIDSENWQLDLPIKVRGIQIS